MAPHLGIRRCMGREVISCVMFHAETKSKEAPVMRAAIEIAHFY